MAKKSLGAKMAKHHRLVNDPKWSERSKLVPKGQPNFLTIWTSQIQTKINSLPWKYKVLWSKKVASSFTNMRKINKFFPKFPSIGFWSFLRLQQGCQPLPPFGHMWIRTHQLCTWKPRLEGDQWLWLLLGWNWSQAIKLQHLHPWPIHLQRRRLC